MSVFKTKVITGNVTTLARGMKAVAVHVARGYQACMTPCDRSLPYAQEHFCVVHVWRPHYSKPIKQIPHVYVSVEMLPETSETYVSESVKYGYTAVAVPSGAVSVHGPMYRVHYWKANNG